MKFIQLTSYTFTIGFLLLTLSCDKLHPSECDLEPDPGLCKASIIKYYFDKTEGKCKEFVWGGCDGVVPFETLEACKQCECF